MADMNFGVNILPNETETYDLGSNNKLWNNVYAKSVTINNDFAATQGYINSVAQNIALTNSEFIISTNTSSSATLTGTLSDSIPIANGKIINYLLTYSTPNNTNLSIVLTYSDNTSTSSIPIYIGASRFKDTLPSYSTISMVYYNNNFYIISLPYAAVM